MKSDNIIEVFEAPTSRKEVMSQPTANQPTTTQKDLFGYVVYKKDGGGRVAVGCTLVKQTPKHITVNTINNSANVKFRLSGTGKWLEVVERETGRWRSMHSPTIRELIFDAASAEQIRLGLMQSQQAAEERKLRAEVIKSIATQLEHLPMSKLLEISNQIQNESSTQNQG
jgi:hypothetical protein